MEHGLDLPPRLQIEFSAVIQGLAEDAGTEIPADRIGSTFESTYLTDEGPPALVGRPVVNTADGRTSVEAVLRLPGGECPVRGEGDGPLPAFAQALARGAGLAVEVLDTHSHALGEGADAETVTYVEARVAGSRVRWGVGRDADPTTALLLAVLRAGRAAGAGSLDPSAPAPASVASEASRGAARRGRSAPRWAGGRGAAAPTHSGPRAGQGEARR